MLGPNTGSNLRRRWCGVDGVVGVGKGRRDEELIGVRGSFTRCVRINSKCDRDQYQLSRLIAL